MWELRSESRAARTAACGLVLGIVSWSIAGCGSPPPPPPPSPQQATDVLTNFLDAWKSGGKTEELATRMPPIRGIDPEWAMNSKLLEYKIDDTGSEFGNSYSVRAKLKIQRTNSRQKHNLQVIYTVSTGDPLTVVRE